MNQPIDRRKFVQGLLASTAAVAIAPEIDPRFDLSKVVISTEIKITTNWVVGDGELRHLFAHADFAGLPTLSFDDPIEFKFKDELE